MPANSIIRTAVLIDGGFFLARYRRVYKTKSHHNPKEIADFLEQTAKWHTKNDYLYRTLYYDARPFEGRATYPISKKEIFFDKTNTAQFRHQFFKCLLEKRKIALRLGKLRNSPYSEWKLRSNTQKQLLNGTKTIADLEDNDFEYDLQQKGVDMRIGLDIASLAYKRLVDKIILISGDSDFVPVLKLARREGIDVVLDSLLLPNISDDLREHIDGLDQSWKDINTQNN